MLFTSWEYAILVAVTFCVFYAQRTTSMQSCTLILASGLFYGYGQPQLLLLLIGSAALNAFCTWRVRCNTNAHTRFVIAAAGVAINVAILVTFKYAGLLGATVAHALQRQTGITEWLISLPLPIGISFYTFEGISLLVDEYRSMSNRADPREVQVLPSRAAFGEYLRDTLLFVMFFPHLVAGPILKAYDFYKQINLKSVRNIDFSYITRKVILGYFLKLVVADNLAEQTFWMQWPYCENQSSAILVALLIAYSAQIFADFAGYSLIAQGCAALYGYRLLDNFNFPYLAASFSEFWRRWHISLSSWLREYLYIPLGGNRRGELRTLGNLIAVMVIGGMWHGAAWRFGTWGLLHGVALAVERVCGRGCHDGKVASWPIIAIRIAGVFGFVSFAWLLFAMPSTTDVWAYVRAIISNTDKPVAWWLGLILAIYVLPIAAYHLLGGVSSVRERVPCWGIEMILGLLVAAIVFNHGNPVPFIYFQF
jgi:alginate O-acetyltransferase complex protein AlgI